MYGTSEILILALVALLVGAVILALRRLARKGRRADPSAVDR